MSVFPVVKDFSHDPFLRFQEDMNQIFGNLLSTGQVSSRADRRLTPVMEVEEGDEAFQIRFEMPGIDRENISVTVENQVLQVSGEHPARQVPAEGRYFASERLWGKYYREVRLPHGVDSEQVHAELKNGILTVTVPKGALIKGRAIPISEA